MILGNGAAIYMNLIAIREDDRSELLVSALLIPLYWLMMSVAAIKGMWQILVNPSYWEKTYHACRRATGDSTSHGDSAGDGGDSAGDGDTADTRTEAGEAT